MQRHSGTGRRGAQRYLTPDENLSVSAVAIRRVDIADYCLLEILIDFDRFPGMIPLPYASHDLCLG
jgi:hypothetical protein